MEIGKGEIEKRFLQEGALTCSNRAWHTEKPGHDDFIEIIAVSMGMGKNEGRRDCKPRLLCMHERESQWTEAAQIDDADQVHGILAVQCSYVYE